VPHSQTLYEKYPKEASSSSLQPRLLGIACGGFWHDLLRPSPKKVPSLWSLEAESPIVGSRLGQHKRLLSKTWIISGSLHLLVSFRTRTTIHTIINIVFHFSSLPHIPSSYRLLYTNNVATSSSALYLQTSTMLCSSRTCLTANLAAKTSLRLNFEVRLEASITCQALPLLPFSTQH